MAVKCTGAEYKAFMASDWGDGYHMDDFVIQVNGIWHDQYGIEHTGYGDIEDEIEPHDKVVIVEGGVYSDDGYVESLEAHFKAWRKKQTTAFLAVECPNDKLEAVKAAIVAAGGKVT